MTTPAAIAPRPRCTRAASTDDADVAVVLIDNAADLETPGGSIGTPLDNAVGYGCWHVARLLVARGARVDKLWHAAALGMLERIEHLVGERSQAADEVSQAFSARLRWRPTTRCRIPTRARRGYQLDSRLRPGHPAGFGHLPGHPPGEPRRLAVRARRYLSEAP